MSHIFGASLAFSPTDTPPSGTHDMICYCVFYETGQTFNDMQLSDLLSRPLEPKVNSSGENDHILLRLAYLIYLYVAFGPLSRL